MVKQQFVISMLKKIGEKRIFLINDIWNEKDELLLFTELQEKGPELDHLDFENSKMIFANSV